MTLDFFNYYKGTTATTNFLLKDYLGSTLKVVNSAGTTLEEHSYDPWGNHRNPANWQLTDFTGSYRGYTGHEHLPQFALINMNGRMYDPVISRILAPDNFVQDETNAQNFNRYSYVINNPLRWTDPSGWMIDDYGLDLKGNITLLRKTDDKFDKLIALDILGNETDKFIKVFDKSILPNLKEKSIAKELKEGCINDVFNVFKFAADNTNVEWGIARYLQNNTNMYAVYTNHKNAEINTPTTWGLTNVQADIHSHPSANTNYYDEMSSMGAVYEKDRFRPSVFYYSDWSNKTRVQNNYSSYVYMKNSSNLYIINKQPVIPSYIKNITNYKDFYFGTLNHR